MTFTRSPGAQKLAAIAKMSGGYPSVAKKLGCSKAAPRLWSSGRRTPTDEWRDRLFAVYAIPQPSWDDVPAPAETPPPVASSSSTMTAKGREVATGSPAAPHPPPTLPAVPDLASTEALLSWAIGCLQTLQASAEADALVPYRERTALLGTVVSALQVRARIRGEDAPSLRKTLASAWWRTIEGAFARGLRGHPLAAAQLARELDALEREGKGHEQEPRHVAGAPRP